MDRLSEYESFLQVSRAGSFTAAAADLGVSASAVSKQVKALEERLGVRLLNRTTRRVALTEEGRAFGERMASILGDIQEAESAVSASASEPRGVLRVGAPMDFGRLHLAEPVARFAASQPGLEIEIELSDRFVDLLAEELDVVVRIGDLVDSSLVSRRLAPCRRVVCASPDYLERHGRPAAVEDLGSHRRIGYVYESERSWLFDAEGGPVRVDVPIRHRSNNGEMMRAMVVAGLGVGLLPTFLVSEELRTGPARSAPRRPARERDPDPRRVPASQASLGQGSRLRRPPGEPLRRDTLLGRGPPPPDRRTPSEGRPAPPPPPPPECRRRSPGCPGSRSARGA